MQSTYIRIFSTNVSHGGCNQASEMSKSDFFSLIVETYNITKIKQLSTVLHYIFDGIIYEEFIGYQAAFQLDAASLLQSILSTTVLLNAMMVLQS